MQLTSKFLDEWCDEQMNVTAIWMICLWMYMIINLRSLNLLLSFAISEWLADMISLVFPSLPVFTVSAMGYMCNYETLSWSMGYLVEMNRFRFFKSNANLTISFQNLIQIWKNDNFKIQILFKFKILSIAFCWKQNIPSTVKCLPHEAIDTTKKYLGNKLKLMLYFWFTTLNAFMTKNLHQGSLSSSSPMCIQWRN